MTNRGKVVYDATIELMAMWMRNPLANESALQEILAKVYDAGQANTPDLDAARWRRMELEFGDLRAKFARYRAVQPTAPIPGPYTTMSTPSVLHSASEWRFECAWIDVSGSADTIPKIITQMLGKERAAAA